ncbi:MAG TPA: phage holin family protein, partial [Gaiellaceae bacterium]|nr:phage holin family protein [Gaiellaceae bacterium]
MSAAYGEAPGWTPERPRFRTGQLVLAWLLAAVSLAVATKLVPGAADSTVSASIVVAALIALLNALLPPLVAALRLPFTALLGFFVVLFVDAGMLLLAGRLSSGLSIDSFWSALGVALAASAVGVVLSTVFGTNDDDVYSLSVVQRIARRSGERIVT